MDFASGKDKVDWPTQNDFICLKQHFLDNPEGVPKEKDIEEGSPLFAGLFLECWEWIWKHKLQKFSPEELREIFGPPLEPDPQEASRVAADEKEILNGGLDVRFGPTERVFELTDEIFCRHYRPAKSNTEKNSILEKYQRYYSEFAAKSDWYRNERELLRLKQEIALSQQPSAAPKQKVESSPKSEGKVHVEESGSRSGASRKGDPKLLEGKDLVTCPNASQYLDKTERHVRNLTKNGKLTSEGQGHNKKITTESLRRYLPPIKTEQKGTNRK